MDLNRRDFLKLTCAAILGAAGAGLRLNDVAAMVVPSEQSGTVVDSFKTTNEAVGHLTENAKMIQGSAVEESVYFPFRSAEAMDALANIKSEGNNPQPTYLVPVGEAVYTVVGVESSGNGTKLQYLDGKGQPKTAMVEGTVDLKVLLGDGYETLSIHRPAVWPDMKANSCTSNLRHPAPGMTDGILCSRDGLRQHYVQGSGKY